MFRQCSDLAGEFRLWKANPSDSSLTIGSVQTARADPASAWMRSARLSTGISHMSAGRAPVALRSANEPPALVRSSIYLPGGVHDALREIAYRERRKVHDIIMEGIDAVLKKRGYPGVEMLKRKKPQE